MTVLNIIIPILTMLFTFLSLGLFIFISLHRKEIRKLTNSQFGFYHRSTDIKLMVNTLMLILLAIEMTHHFLIATSYLLNHFISISNIPNIWNTNCTIVNSNILKLLHKSGWILLSPIDISYSSSTLVLSATTVLIRVLKKRYINAPYQKLIKDSVIFILFRFLLQLTLFSTPYTYYIALVLKLICIYDLYVYIYHSHSIYTLLKGRRTEAKWYLSQKDFRENTRVCKEYLYTSILCVIIFSLFTAEQFLSCINGFLDLISHNTCFLRHYTLGYIPELTFDPLTQRILSNFIKYSSILELTFRIFHQLLTMIIYSFVFTVYCMHFCRRNIHTTTTTPVYVQRYTNTIMRRFA